MVSTNLATSTNILNRQGPNGLCFPTVLGKRELRLATAGLRSAALTLDTAPVARPSRMATPFSAVLDSDISFVVKRKPWPEPLARVCSRTILQPVNNNEALEPANFSPTQHLQERHRASWE